MVAATDKASRPQLGTMAAILGSLDGHNLKQEGANRLRILSRHPDRWAEVQPIGWSVDVAWCSPRPGQGRIPYQPEAVIKDLVENTSNATTYILDVLDINGPAVDDVSNWLLLLDDCSADVDSQVYVCIEDGLHDSTKLARWATILPQVTPPSESLPSPGEPSYGPSKNETIAESNGSIQPELDVHEIQHLTRLPSKFSTDALRRRILQWRRMGFDVSDLESALVQDSEHREHIYRHVEENVRRAIDLDRRLTMMAEHLPATDVERDRFRLRQLTGLDQIELSLNQLMD
jgi:hypothetical protein